MIKVKEAIKIIEKSIKSMPDEKELYKDVYAI